MCAYIIDEVIEIVEDQEESAEITPVVNNKLKQKCQEEIQDSGKYAHNEAEIENTEEVASLKYQKDMEKRSLLSTQEAENNSSEDSAAAAEKTTCDFSESKQPQNKVNEEFVEKSTVNPNCPSDANELSSESKGIQQSSIGEPQQCTETKNMAPVSEETAISFNDIISQMPLGKETDRDKHVEHATEIPVDIQEAQFLIQKANENNPGASRSMESLEDALQMAAASIEQQAEEGKQLKRKEARERRRERRGQKKNKLLETPVEYLMQEQQVEEALAEHDPDIILDEVAPEELPKELRKAIRRRSGKKRSLKRKRMATRRSSEHSPSLKRLKASPKKSPDVEKRVRRSKEKQSPKTKQRANIGSLKVQLHGQVLNKRRRKPEKEAEIVIEAVSDHGSTAAEERDTPTPKILTAKRLIECRPEPNRLHVAATPGVYAIKKRGSWLMCGLCPFRSKEAADISLHLRQFDFYDMRCPKCQHVVTRTHRGPDNKILSCLHCDYRNGDHLEIRQTPQPHVQLEPTVLIGTTPPSPPKEDIVAIAAKMILEDDEEEPQIISEITDESGHPVRVLSVERDLEELVKAGVVTLCNDGVSGNLAQVNITTQATDVVHIDVPSSQIETHIDSARKVGSTRTTNVSPKKVPSILRRRKKPSGKQ